MNKKNVKNAAVKNYFNAIAASSITKFSAVVLAMLLVIAVVCIARPFAGTVDNAEKIEYALHANDFRIDRLEVAANGTEDVKAWKYLAVIENGEVSMMTTVNAQQYMMLNEGDVVVGHLVIMTSGESVFAFEGDDNNCEVICYNQIN